jgi:hypothetical protein
MRGVAAGMAVVGVVLSALCAGVVSDAHAASSWSYGKYWAAATSAEGTRLETRPAAQAFGDAMSAIGYANTTDLDGETAQQGWVNGSNAQVFGWFGHADFDKLVLDDPTPGTDLYTTGQLHSANYAVYTVAGAANVRAWWAYQPELADDMKVAVLGGCHTAAQPTDGNSWFLVSRLIGVDSVVGFSDLIFSPSDPGGTGSGTYFWQRFSAYAQAGYMVRDALSLARADLFATQGNNWGYDQWAVGGAATDPGAVRFTPASAGALNVFGWNFIPQPPVATARLDLRSLTVTRQTPATAGGDTFTDHETAEGVSYRLDQNWDLVNFVAPATASGDSRISDDQALAAATDFAAAHVSWFDEHSFAVTAERKAEHFMGDSLLAVEWRPEDAAGVAGPAAVRAEVDLRTGNVVALTAQRADPAGAAFDVTRDEAITAARAALGGASGPVEAVTQDRWRGPRWTVRIARGQNALGTTVKSIAVIDGRTGAVTQTATAA